MLFYYVASSCINNDCSNKRYHKILDALNYASAQSIALEWRKKKADICPACHSSLTFYAMTEKND